MRVLEVKRRVWIIIIILVIVILFVSTYKEKGTFQDLIMNNYFDKSVAKDYDTVIIRRISSENRFNEILNDNNKINELMSKLNEYEVQEYSKRKHESTKHFLDIFLESSSTGEYLAITIREDNWLWIHMKTIISTGDENNRIIETRHIETQKYFKVINKDIDYNYFNSLIDSLETKK